MKTFKQLTGYMGNQFVKEDHVFISGEGCFYETKEKAREIYNNKPNSANGANFEFTVAIVDGVEVYNYHETNIYN
ncbi:MAG: hypothetical protein LLF98_02315 [Clostridium sp.]|uniref:hypothetical protein n=1 Tax=Clostridium sp. TaxID=1506 RepID=UPI0025C610BB|nr:hypothetical protein [Clostridium sp.]MCE5220116.1 hypothetical protein [Clostridium sp.]